MIHSIDEKYRIKFYLFFIQNKKYINCLQGNDLIQIYNFFFNKYIFNYSILRKYFTDLTTIINALFARLQKTEKIGDESLHIVLVVLSFVDIYIYYVLYSIINNKNKELEKLFWELKNITQLYFQLSLTKKNILDKACIYKIICLLCILYSFYNSSTEFNIKEQIIEIVLANESICLQTLNDIFFQCFSLNLKKIN